MTEMAESKIVHAVRTAAAVERIGQQHGVVDGMDRDAVAEHDEHVELQVLADF